MDPYLGEIRLTAWPHRIPANWLLCDGSMLEIADYANLYSLIGVAFGGDGQTTFALPDLRGRIPIGQGQGAMLSSRTLGERGGVETVTLQTEHLPAHTHGIVASQAPATDVTPSQTSFLAAATGTDVRYIPPPATLVAMDPAMVSEAGGQLEHDNRMPTLALNYIICINGIYPMRPPSDEPPAVTDTARGG